MRTREEDSSFGKKGMRDDSRKKVLGEKRERVPAAEFGQGSTYSRFRDRIR